jgi:hypothetical protein
MGKVYSTDIVVQPPYLEMVGSVAGALPTMPKFIQRTAINLFQEQS